MSTPIDPAWSSLAAMRSRCSPMVSGAGGSPKRMVAMRAMRAEGRGTWVTTARDHAIRPLGAARR